MTLHAERRGAVDRYLALNRSIARFGIVGAQAPKPKVVHIEGCGSGALDR